MRPQFSLLTLLAAVGAIGALLGLGLKVAEAVRELPGDVEIVGWAFVAVIGCIAIAGTAKVLT